MRSSIIFFLIPALFIHPCFSQTKAQITDVDFHLEDRYIVVNYNLTGTLPKEQLTIDLKFLTENSETITPRTVTGDAGTKEFGAGMKTILWDVVADQVELSGSLKASVTITSSKILYSGPSNALLSVLIPGLGGYFVGNSKARAVLTTMSVAGLMGYGIFQKIKADQYYVDYNSSKVTAEIPELYTIANDANHKYFLATRIAAGIWALDIIYVAIKGGSNRKAAESAYSSFSGGRFSINYACSGLQIGYYVTF